MDRHLAKPSAVFDASGLLALHDAENFRAEESVRLDRPVSAIDAGAD
jgi:hypothetical protein